MDHPARHGTQYSMFCLVLHHVSHRVPVPCEHVSMGGACFSLTLGHCSKLLYLVPSVLLHPYILSFRRM